MSYKPLVLIIGVTGRTGGDIANGVLATGSFRVAAIVRPESIDKPEIAKLKAAGVDIRPGDIVSDSVEKLTSLLQGVDILISTVLPFTDQKPVFKAAKTAGVKRVLPSEFGPFVPKGLMPFIDEKYAIREFIQDLGLNYTFILIGWWLETMWPYPHRLKDLSQIEQRQNDFYAEGDKLVACTSRKSIGELVARIISDPRTLNQVIMAYDLEISKKEIWRIAEKITAEDFSDYPRVSAEEVRNKAQSADLLTSILYGYTNSVYVRGDNTVTNAKKNGGALDVRELYPDYQPLNSEEFAVQFYKEPTRSILPASTASKLAIIS